MASSALSIERPGEHDVAPLRVAVVGAGGWGAQHARVVTERVDTELVGIVGRDAGRTELAAGTITCLGIGPAGEAELDRLTGNLPLL